MVNRIPSAVQWNAGMLGSEREEQSRSQVLPFVLLKEFAASSADPVYGENLRLSDDLLLHKRNGLGETRLLRLLREAVLRLKPPPPSHHALVRTEATKRPLQRP